MTMLGAMLLAAAAFGQPEPSPAPVSWELKFEPTPPARIQVDTGNGARTYWYLLYTVTNETGQDIDFHPEVVRVNEIESEATIEQAHSQPAKAPHITVDPAVVGLHTRIYEAIKERHKKTHPFLKPPVEAIGRLLQGKDNARSSVIVFPDLDPRISSFTIYVTGLSGEVVTRPNPLSGKMPAGGKAKQSSSEDEGGGQSNAKGSDGEKNPKFFVLRKTLALPYTMPGDTNTRRTAEPKLGRMTWVMR